MLFGFALSALQQRMAIGQASYFELTGHFWGEDDDMGPGERDNRRARRARKYGNGLSGEEVDSDRRDSATQIFLDGTGLVGEGLAENLPPHITGRRSSADDLLAEMGDLDECVLPGSGGAEVGGDTLKEK